MSTIQHINSTLDHFWPEYQRRFPAFDKPEIVPAETLRGMAPVYMRRLIDQDPSSYYLFVHADPMRGDASRDRMVEFVDDFFYEKLGMPSSYDMMAGQGGDLPREQAVDKEVMPARDDREYQRYFDEQMAAAEAQHAEQRRQKRIDDLGFDPDDGNTIDVDIGDDGVARRASDTRAVGQAQSTAVGMPKRIWFAVDFHCPSGGMLGYNGGAGGRLGGRGGRRFLRETESETPVGDILAAFMWAREQGLTDGMIQIAKAKPDAGASPQNAEIHDRFDLFIVKYADGTFTWIEKPVSGGGYSVTWKKISTAESADWSAKYQLADAVVLTSDEIAKIAPTLESEESDPEKMMKEFVELVGGQMSDNYIDDPDGEDADLEKSGLKTVGCHAEPDDYDGSRLGYGRAEVGDRTFKIKEDDVEEDEYRRPKNQPHNLHQVDEKDDGKKAKDYDEGAGDEDEDGGEAEDESEELNESMVRFCDRLIRG